VASEGKSKTIQRPEEGNGLLPKAGGYLNCRKMIITGASSRATRGLRTLPQTGGREKKVLKYRAFSKKKPSFRNVWKRGRTVGSCIAKQAVGQKEKGVKGSESCPTSGDALNKKTGKGPTA